MRKTAIGIFLGLLALGALLPGAAGAQTLFFDYVGYDYEAPNLDPLQFGEVGSGYVSLGLVPGLFAPLVPNTVANEYTYYIAGLTALGQFNIGPFVVISYSPGILSVYEDSKSSGTAADFGVNPPNATAPPSFVDGNLFVTGTLTNFQYILNTVDGTGSYEADFEVTGGSEVSNGNIPANQRKGWTFAGTSANELNMPEGYAHQVDGQVFLNEPVPTRATTWGGLKAKYR
jgi:hypothetical protein